MESRKDQITMALAAYRERGDTRTETVEFRGQLAPFEVIRISTNIPVLNHNNSRLRAQLLMHPEHNKVLENPGSDASQQILSDLLARTEKFGELKEQLSGGQRHPGVITRDGMLVNGNTRLVALRRLGMTAMDVAVLPEDANSEDFLNIELSLQMKKYIHQDYTYTNRLLLHKSLAEHYPNRTAIFESLGWQKNGEKRLNDSLRRLALIEEIMSSTELDYSYFDSKEEMIKNLDETYQQRLLEDPAEAEKLKWNRIFGMQLGLNKDEVRIIDSDFLEDHLHKRIEDDVAGVVLNSFKREQAPDGLDELLGETENRSAFDVKKFVSSMSKRQLEGADGAAIGEDVLGSLYRESKAVAQNLIQETIAEGLRSGPITNLRDVTDRIQKLTKELPTIFSDDEFDKGKFVFQARKTQKALQELQSELARQIERSED